jgi:RHS repeat-associated protein
LKLQEQHIYGSARLGVVKPDLEMIGAVDPSDVGEFDRVRGMKRYELSNHLGNVLTVISDRKIATVDNGVNIYYHAEIISYSDYYPFGAPMSQSNTDRTWSVEEYRYGFNGKEDYKELFNSNDSFQDYGLRCYDTRIAKFISVDPLTSEFPWYSTFQFAGNNPIKFIDLDGAEPKDPGKDNGEIRTAKISGQEDLGDKNWLWTGNTWEITAFSKAVEITAEKSNADHSWKEYIGNFGSENFDNYVQALYQAKLEPYQVQNGMNIGLYGRNSDGTVAVPNEIKSKLRAEAGSEAMPALKAAWAKEKSGVDPNSISYSLNPFERSHYNHWRTLAVSSSNEAWDVIAIAGMEIATSWMMHVKATSQAIKLHQYPRVNGGGLNFYVNGERTIGLDWHEFKLGGKKTGKTVNLPHVDLDQARVKHFPWKQGDKYIRGVK